MCLQENFKIALFLLLMISLANSVHPINILKLLYFYDVESLVYAVFFNKHELFCK